MCSSKSIHMLTLSPFSRTKNLFRHLPHSLYHTLEPAISLLNLVEHSIKTNSLELTHQCHARAHRFGLTEHSMVAQKLIFSYCHFKSSIEARLVFDCMSIKNTHVCNTLLSGYGKNHLLEESLKLFKGMCQGSVLTDEFSFSAMFKILGDFNESLYGKIVHGRGLRSGFVLDVVVGNSLMSMYGKCGSFDDCLKVFDEMPVRNVSSWNAVISVHSKTGVDCFREFGISEFVNLMKDEGLKFDAFTVSTLLSLCCGDTKIGEKWNHGRELHCYIIKNGLDLISGSDNDIHIGCCLIGMYCKNDRVNVGRSVFNQLKQRNVFVWTAMINGYTYCSNFDEALLLFHDMQHKDGILPSKVSLVSILPACSSSGGLMGGKQIHGFAIRRELNHEISLCNALIDMYSKSGSLTYATRVFNSECTHKDAISWSSIISGYSLHGHGAKAIQSFNKMLENGIKPDTTVIVGILSACCRSGLLNDGIRIYDSVVAKYMINPTMEICSCMVDMLGRSGQLDRALEFIKTIPFEPGPSIWGALMSASALHGNTEMQELAHKSLIQMEPENSSNYISLSNLYASSKRWDEVAEIRKKMKERRLRKMPGCSWITVSNRTHSFFVADKTHPSSELIYILLGELVATMKLTSFNSDFVHLVE